MSSTVLLLYSECEYWIFLQKVNKGQVPPAFTLKDQDGKNVSLSKFKGKPVVVYFYPADETPGCTKQVLKIIIINNNKLFNLLNSLHVFMLLLGFYSWAM